MPGYFNRPVRRSLEETLADIRRVLGPVDPFKDMHCDAPDSEGPACFHGADEYRDSLGEGR